MTKLFGTDGIRSRANTFPMNAESVLKIAKLCALKFKNKGNNVLIGKDTRRSGYVFESCIVAGALSCGMDAILVGPVPTPAVSVLTKSLRCGFGVMISASHNKYCDNGLKIFNGDGIKIKKNDELFIEKNFDLPISGICQDFGKAIRLQDASGRYIECVKKSFPDDMTLHGIKIVLDCANGSAYNIAQKVFWELGAQVKSINDKPDGCNINLNCGAIYPQSLQKSVIEEGADIGFALDGDADRLVVCNELGQLIDGDQIIASIAEFLLNCGKLCNKTIAITDASSVMLERFLAKLGIKIIKTEVGDKNVLEAMLKTGANFGAEPSGHIIMKDYCPTSDALVAALQILHILKKSGMPISKAAKKFIPMPKVMENVAIVDNQNCENKIYAAREYANTMSEHCEKILIRKSGTESVIRVIAEGNNITKIKELVKKVCGTLC